MNKGTNYLYTAHNSLNIRDGAYISSVTIDGCILCICLINDLKYIKTTHTDTQDTKNQYFNKFNNNILFFVSHKRFFVFHF